ncbi:hypothetical protein CHS0354_007886 [Potamilus streckersoni]|uniref:Beta-1,4-galactosyltransferase n=1 Tax=Potamilus streckersoni TaxID=2493646 RepID=A0AAE0SZG6_9BIVA|nr:hypothetical protein CHS0354_007886 [Potamilus streckersoni]
MTQTGICNQGLLGRGLLLVVISLISIQLLVNMVMYERTNTAVYSLVFSYVQTQNSSVLMRNTTLETPTSTLPMCPLIPTTLRGVCEIDTHIPSWSEIEANNSALQPGGKYRPQSCTARNRVAIIVPYRDREMHLKLFLQNIHPFLQRQQLDYTIFLVELAPDKMFNRAMLMNIGFVEAIRLYDFQCFIFHDVDLLPEDDRNLYTCPPMPRHMSAAIDKHKYRILYSKMTITRYPMTIARYKMLDHVKDKENPKRFRLLKESKQRWQHDGLNSLKYQRLKLEFRKLYTWVFVDFSEKDVIIPENVTTPTAFVPNLMNNDQTVMKETMYVSSNIKNADVTPVWTRQSYVDNSAISYDILSTSVTKSQNEVTTVNNKLSVQPSYIHLR